MKTITRRRLIWGVPLIAATVAGGGFATMLSGLRKGSFDPHAINIPMLNKPVPEFSINTLSPYADFDSEYLKKQQIPILINFFASWCLPCVQEMPVLQNLSQKIAIWGIAYKDQAASIQQFLTIHANPYQRIGMDPDGMTGINWGLSGVPESFLVMPGGIIRWHYPRPLNQTAIDSLVSLIK